MTFLIQNRIFQLWEYRVSHGSLLIRSPRGSGVNTNVDIRFVGVRYLEVPRYLHGVEIVPPNEEELRRVETVLGKSVPSDTVHVLLSQDLRFVVVAAGIKIEDSDCDIFESPFSS